MRQRIITVIDFFYPPFQKVMPVHTFRYAACGVANLLLDIVLYFISYHFILQKKIFQIGIIAFEPHIGAFIIAFTVSFPVGFLLSKYIVWLASPVLWYVQLFRYFIIVIVNVFLNYVFIKVLVEYWQVYPTIAKIITTFFITIFSYLSQKYFTFKAHTTKPPGSI